MGHQTRTASWHAMSMRQLQTRWPQYMSGVFNREKLIVGDGDTAAQHEDELRDKNIYLTKLM